MREDEFDVYVRIVNHQEHFYKLLNKHFYTALELSQIHTTDQIIYTPYSKQTNKRIQALTGWITTFGKRIRPETEDIDPTRSYTIITNGERP